MPHPLWSGCAPGSGNCGRLDPSPQSPFPEHAPAAWPKLGAEAVAHGARSSCARRGPIRAFLQPQVGCSPRHSPPAHQLNAHA